MEETKALRDAHLGRRLLGGLTCPSQVLANKKLGFSSRAACPDLIHVCSQALHFQIAACWDDSWAKWGRLTSLLSSARAEAQVMMPLLLHPTYTHGKPPQSHKGEPGVTSHSQGKQANCCLARSKVQDPRGTGSHRLLATQVHAYGAHHPAGPPTIHLG